MMADSSKAAVAESDPPSLQPSKRRRRILVAYSMSSTYTSATLDYLLALKRHSDYDVDYVHVTHDARLDFDINDYDVVLNNYCARFPFEGYVGKSYQSELQRFRGLKIIAVQDDYDRTSNLHRAIRGHGFHILLTCIQPDFWPLVYPASELPGLRIIQGLTGYLPESSPHLNTPPVPLADRQLWIAYRGRRLGAKYGRLGFEKEEIGLRMKAICVAKGVPHDIAVDEASRIYGNDWYKFLSSSRAMLGSESACNVFDFDGDVEQQVEVFRATHHREPLYEDLRDTLAPIERYFDVGQISPRVFECALMRTPMVLFRGRYSDAIEPDTHYIPLERDFSNADEVLAKLADLDLLQGIADRTHERLVSSGRYGYRSLAKLLVQTIEEEYPRRIDPAWVNFRAATAAPWRPAMPIDDAKTGEEIRRKLLIERPTDMPLSQADFQAKQDALLNASWSVARRGLGRFFIFPGSVAGRGSLKYRMARSLWRLLPQDLRHGIAGYIRSLF